MSKVDPACLPGDMAQAWQVLSRGGLPLAGSAAANRPTPAELAAAVRQVRHAGPPPPGRPRDALCAFLLAWRHHWPASFAQAFGEEADAVAGWARSLVDDADRFLKLRRIATARLAEII